jgi:DNA polymerase III subunit epsilon
VRELILESLAGRLLVAHAAWVERGFLSAAFKPVGVRVAEPVLDTAVIARHVLSLKKLPDDGAVSLSDAARGLGLPTHSPHIAEGDALTTAQLFLEIAARLDGPSRRRSARLLAGRRDDEGAARGGPFQVVAVSALSFGRLPRAPRAGGCGS